MTEPKRRIERHVEFQFGIRSALLVTVWFAALFAVWTQFGAEVAMLLVALPTLIVGIFFPFTRVTSGCLFGILLMFGVLLPAVSTPRSVTRKYQCSSNLNQIALALLKYHDEHGTYPPAYIADEAGRPMHSWRVLILPYLERKDLYAQYNFDEPWDGPNNRKLLAKCPEVYMCPSQSNMMMTSYVAVVGKETAWPGATGLALSAATVKGGSTLMVVETANANIQWMEPRDLSYDTLPRTVNSASGASIGSGHPGGANVTMADRSVWFLSEDTSPEELSELLTVAGGDSVELD